MKSGVVYWITGLSGSGKTTVGKLVYEKIREYKKNIAFLDGDTLREVFGNDLTYCIQDRKKSAIRNARLCKLLSDQSIDVICCTISMFNDVQRWNRENIQNYYEIYLKVPLNILKERDRKGLYNSLEKGQESNVYGVDLKYEEPLNPDIQITNDGSSRPEQIAKSIINRLLPIIE